MKAASDAPIALGLQQDSLQIAYDRIYEPYGMPFPQISTYSRAYKAVTRYGGQTITMEHVLVGRSRTEIALTVLGVPPAQALRLARILVRRIRA